MTYILDLHTHTVASGHAFSTIQENVAIAKRNGLKHVGISDHAPTLPGSAYIYYFQNLKIVPSEIDGVHVLKGVEANIINHKGHLDMRDEDLNNLDFTIASMHPPCLKFGSIDQNTRAVIGAMKNRYVSIIGHPDDSRFPLDYDEIVKAARDYGVLLEVNNASLNPKGFRMNSKDNTIQLLERCQNYKVPIIMGSDAHISFNVGCFDYCLDVINEINFDSNLIMNASYEDLMPFLNRR